ncbi:unnamed protein product [Microthlaspi erraticum]|uniref:Reverse transcriptase domain-containing protein n=1 Tax=Microthlaspi erraticum TaxID=1685480 RepID=A0A6D2JQG9_9BRAS|nr:unnamed protein product [Microthlaspi erraticum]
MDEEPTDPLILGRPFLATARAMIDVCEGTIELNLGKGPKDEMSFWKSCLWKIPTSCSDQGSRRILSSETEDELDQELDRVGPRTNELDRAGYRCKEQAQGDWSELKAPKSTSNLCLRASVQKAIGYTLDDIKGISPDLCIHRIHLEDESKSSIEPQRRLNPNLKEVVKKEILKLLDAGIIYPISDSTWISPVHCVPKKGGSLS